MTWRREFCEKARKAELHAHLHGSARVETLMQVAELFGSSEAQLEALKKVRALKSRSLADCFVLFDLVHQLIRDERSLAFITKQVVQDFASDNVVYVELRSTPRETEFLSRRQYIETVARTVRETQQGLDIQVNLLVSMNRANGVREAEETLHVVLHQLSKEARAMIVGIDFSGNPIKGCFDEYLPVLTKARANGLRITVHCGEVDDAKDVDAILAFKPDRLGHALKLSREARKRLTELSEDAIPVECCPTSNYKTLELDSLKQHPNLGVWLKNRYPICVCTDDAGIFQTSLSKDLWMVADAFNLNREEISQIISNGFRFAFNNFNHNDVINRRHPKL